MPAMANVDSKALLAASWAASVEAQRVDDEARARRAEEELSHDPIAQLVTRCHENEMALEELGREVFMRLSDIQESLQKLQVAFDGQTGRGDRVERRNERGRR